MDPWWNPQKELQAEDRVYRIGQRNPVKIIRIIANNTVDRYIQMVQAKKRLLFDRFVNDIDMDAEEFQKRYEQAQMDIENEKIRMNNVIQNIQAKADDDPNDDANVGPSKRLKWKVRRYKNRIVKNIGYSGLNPS